MSDDAGHDDDDRGLLGRARRLAGRFRRAPDRADSPLVTTTPDGGSARQGLVPAAVEAVIAPLLRAVGGRLVDLADFTASRLLELDEAAAELAVFVERITRAHGDGIVLRVLLRHNLLLDGTILALLEPLLRGGRRSSTAPPFDTADPRAIARGRETLTDLVVILASLDEHADSDELPPRPAPEVDRLDLLESLGFDQEFPRVFAWLEGRATPEEDARFVLGSYLIFLETFLLRAMARNLNDLPALVAGTRRSGTPPLTGD